MNDETECVYHLIVLLIRSRLRLVGLLVDLGLFITLARPHGNGFGWRWLDPSTSMFVCRDLFGPEDLEDEVGVLNTSAGNKPEGRRKVRSLSLHLIHLGCGCYGNHRLFSEGLRRHGGRVATTTAGCCVGESWWRLVSPRLVGGTRPTSGLLSGI